MHDDHHDLSHSELWQHARRSGMERRRFLYLLSAGGAAAVLAACKGMGTVAEQHDCIVIGSGPVGMASALRLAENGIRVLILEGGTAITQPEGSHFRNQAQFKENPDSYFGAIDPYLIRFVDSPNNILPGLADSSLYGGQGVIWTNNCPRASEFELWDALTSAEWDQRYDEAERHLGVKPAPSANSQTGNNIRNRLAAELESGRVIRDLPFSGRVSGDGSVYFNAPYDMLHAASQDVINNVEVRAGINVTRIVYSGERVTGIDVEGPNGKEHLRTRTLLVAGGAVGTPKLLYRSAIRPPALGRGFSFHALLFGQIVLDENLSAPGQQTDLPPRLWIPPTADRQWHIQVMRDTYPVPVTEVVDNPHRLLEFQVFLPIEYRDANRFIFLDNDRVELDFSFSPTDLTQMRAMEEDVRTIAGHLGHWRGGGGEIAFVPHGTAHLVGTCRMDLTGWEGVADKKGKVHGFSNLYLASVGLIPAPVAVNPTLTAAALAMQTVDDLMEQI